MKQEDDPENRIMRNSQLIFSFLEYVASMEEIGCTVHEKLWSENLKEIDRLGDSHVNVGFKEHSVRC